MAARRVLALGVALGVGSVRGIQLPGLARPTKGYAPLAGVQVTRVNDGRTVNLGQELGGGPKLLVLGTYAADFNAIEYGQKLRHYLPGLRGSGVKKAMMVLNADVDACKAFAKFLDLPKEVELLSDPTGEAGRAFGCSRGWLPDANFSPYLKLFGMLWGLGAIGTLPSVIAGYIGNPNGYAGWIESSLAQGQRAGRWPNNAVDLGADGKVVGNAFNDLPVVGGWGRRPLELATLRLQNMIGVSLEHWEELKPTDENTLTQLGGCVVVDGDGEAKYEWRDPGICGVAHFEDILQVLAKA